MTATAPKPCPVAFCVHCHRKLSEELCHRNAVICDDCFSKWLQREAEFWRGGK